MRTNKTISVIALLVFGGLQCFQAQAQTAPEPKPRVKTHVQGKKPIVATGANPVIVDTVDSAPHIVTILHRLNGLKVFRLLARSHVELGAIVSLDDAFKFTTEVHTNVIAGLALDDGRTIAAWLPEAEAELPLPIQYAPVTPPAPPTAPAPAQPPSRQPVPPVVGSVLIPGFPAMPITHSFYEPANLKVITRDGKRTLGRYIGLDGLTGLSVITLPNNSLPRLVEPKAETIQVGQRLHVIGPQPAPRPETAAKNAMYVRIGQTDAVIVDVNRASSGSIARIKIRSGKLSAANIGGIAVNEAGETLGIVDGVEGTEATVVPVSLVRSAVKRVVARQSSVPRPWLGIRGEPIEATSLEKVIEVGWQLERARELCEKNNGILLTSVAPGSPAALNQLKPGDVILSVNNELIRKAEDLTWLLQEAASGTSVSFTVARPDKVDSLAFDIKLSESPDPFFGRRVAAAAAPKYSEPGSLMAQGIETVAIKQRVATTRFGATGGLLVVSVRPETSAAQAGLRAGDVIEAIDGQLLTSGKWRKPLIKNPGASSAFTIVRNKQRLVVTIATIKR